MKVLIHTSLALQPITLNVKLERDDEGDDASDPSAIAPFYPNKKMANWWLVVGDPGTKNLLSIKRVTITRNLSVKLDFTLPKVSPGFL